MLFSAQHASVRKELNSIIHDVTLSLSQGELLSLVGAAGSGKTTLAQLVASDLHPYEGTVQLLNAATSFFVPQQDNFFSQTGMSLTYYSQRYEYQEENAEIPVLADFLISQVEDFDVELGEKLATVVSDKIYDVESIDSRLCALKLLNVFPILDRNILQLSNGERKRTQIALALMHDADLYVFDQPFLGLDTETRNLLLVVLSKLKGQRKGIFLVCGSREVPDFSDFVLTIESGRIVRRMTASQFIVARDADASASTSFDMEKLAELSEITTKNSQKFGFIVKMNDVHITMQGETLLHDVNWEVKDNERWLLAGHNGSGKSTLLSLITADNPQAYANDIQLFGRQRGSGESIWDIKKKIGFVSPELHLYFLRQSKLSSSSHVSVDDISCVDVIVSGLNDEVGFVGSVTNWQQKIALQWMEALNIDYLSNKTFTEISLGEQRMLLLVRALVKNPPLLILDEPCQGIDFEQSQRFIRLLDVICTSLDSTLIYVSHSPDEIPLCITHRIELENGTVKSIGKIA